MHNLRYKSNHKYPVMGSNDHKPRRCAGRQFCTRFSFFCTSVHAFSLLRFWSLSTITKVLNPLRLISLSLTSARCETLAGATGSKLGEPSIPQRSKHSPVPSIRRSPRYPVVVRSISSGNLTASPSWAGQGLASGQRVASYHGHMPDFPRSCC